MTNPLKPHTKRIKELNDKATQVLLFLSFAMVAAVTLRPNLTHGQELAVTLAMRWWTGAIFFALVCFLRRLKAVVLWLALICLAIGAGWFWFAI
jgi:hypothetical protein